MSQFPLKRKVGGGYSPNTNMLSPPLETPSRRLRIQSPPSNNYPIILPYQNAPVFGISSMNNQSPFAAQEKVFNLFSPYFPIITQLALNFLVEMIDPQYYNLLVQTAISHNGRDKALTAGYIAFLIDSSGLYDTYMTAYSDFIDNVYPGDSEIVDKLSDKGCGDIEDYIARITYVFINKQLKSIPYDLDLAIDLAQGAGCDYAVAEIVDTLLESESMSD